MRELGIVVQVYTAGQVGGESDVFLLISPHNLLVCAFLRSSVDFRWGIEKHTTSLDLPNLPCGKTWGILMPEQFVTCDNLYWGIVLRRLL